MALYYRTPLSRTVCNQRERMLRPKPPFSAARSRATQVHKDGAPWRHSDTWRLAPPTMHVPGWRAACLLLACAAGMAHALDTPGAETVYPFDTQCLALTGTALHEALPTLYTSHEAIYDEALRLLNLTRGAPDARMSLQPNQIVVTVPRAPSCGLLCRAHAQARRWTRQQLQRTPGAPYAGPLREAMATLLELVLSSTPSCRPAHTYYDATHVWPDEPFVGNNGPLDAGSAHPNINGWEAAVWGPFVGGIARTHVPAMQSIQDAHDAAPKTHALRTLARRWMLPPSPTAPACHAACQVRDYAVRLLEYLAFLSDADTQAVTSDAAWVLGEHSLWGTHGALPNVSRALHAYERLAAAGNASAHSRLGFLYGSSVVHSLLGVPDDPARAIAHYAAAAKQGERHATLALAYRSLHGLGVRESCMRALHLYEHEARSAYTQSQAVLGGRTPSYTKWPVHRLEQWEQRTRQMPSLLHLPPKRGIFWRYQRHHMVPKILEEQPRLVYDPEFRYELLQVLDADPSEDLEQYLFLALALYHGSMISQSETIAAVPRDFARSAELAQRVVHHYWPVDLAQAPSKTLNEHDLGVVAEAAELLGMQYLRGEGVPKDEHRAALWFERSRRAYGEYGLGLLDLYGLAGHVRDPDAAQTHFANRSFITSPYPAARLEVAKYGLARGNLTLAHEGLDTPLLSFGDHWYAVYPRVEQPYIEGLVAAEDLRRGNATCKLATRKLKEAAERGDWADPIYHRGTAAYARDDIPTALLAFALAAEQGMPSAQENVAYLLESRTCFTDADNRVISRRTPNPRGPLALRFWAQSAVQKGEGAVHMCDAQLASGNRQAAIDCFGHLARRGVRIAYWRLGWLYETGPTPDYALAKRNYDLAMQDGPHTETLYAFLVYVRLGLRVLWHVARHCDPWLLWAFATA